MNRSDLIAYTQLQVQLRSHWRQELALPRNAEPKRLLVHGHKAYSQNDEDGILAEIFRRIGTETRHFVEFGVGNGLECNSLLLLTQGWTGGWMEAKQASIDAMRKTHQGYLQSGQLKLMHTVVTPETVDDQIAALSPGPEIDLLSIDTDYHDYWLWKAVERSRPRVVVVEYNATWPPPMSVTVPYAPGAGWTGNNHFGASLAALAKLGREKGYLLVGCCFAGVNAFFVREDLVGDQFHAPGDAEAHYEPARYFMSSLASGHPPGLGPLVQV